MEEFEYARDRILMGLERKSLKRADQQLMDTSIHEAGHVLTIYYVLGAEDIYKSTILPHGHSLGGVPCYFTIIDIQFAEGKGTILSNARSNEE